MIDNQAGTCSNTPMKNNNDNQPKEETMKSDKETITIGSTVQLTRLPILDTSYSQCQMKESRRTVVDIRSEETGTFVKLNRAKHWLRVTESGELRNKSLRYSFYID